MVLLAASLHNRLCIVRRWKVKRQPGESVGGSIQDPLSVASTSPNDHLTRYEVRIHTSCEADLVSSRLSETESVTVSSSNRNQEAQPTCICRGGRQVSHLRSRSGNIVIPSLKTHFIYSADIMLPIRASENKGFESASSHETEPLAALTSPPHRFVKRSRRSCDTATHQAESTPCQSESKGQCQMQCMNNFL